MSVPTLTGIHEQFSIEDVRWLSKRKALQDSSSLTNGRKTKTLRQLAVGYSVGELIQCAPACLHLLTHT